MFERDYILRVIKQFVEALARITARKNAKEYAQALEEVADAAKALVGMTAMQLVMLPVGSLLDLVRNQGAVDVDRAAATARLLKEHGEIVDLMGAGGSRPYYIKAFCLLDEIAKIVKPEEMEKHSETLEWLVDRLG